MAETQAEPGKEDLMARYERQEKEREARQDAELPTLARKREEEAAAAVENLRNAVRAMLSKGMLKAAGYRLVIKPLEGTLGLEEAEKEVAPELANRGFQVKSHNELEREERGENHGIVMDIGPIAFDKLGGRAAWCDVGDLVVFSRYAGTRVEHPRGSGVFYQIMNDEDIFGRLA